MKNEVYEAMSEEAKEIYREISSLGFDDAQISAAMADGEYLLKEGIDEEIAEELYKAL